MSTMTHELKVTIAADLERTPTNGPRVLDSSRELLESVWHQVAPKLSRMITAMNILGDRRDDVLQDVYLASLRKAPQGLKPVELKQWLFRVTANRCHLEHRRRQRWLGTWLDLTKRWPLGEPSRGVEKAARQDEEKRLIQQALESMPHTLRTVLVLRYFNEFNSKEIGAILELPDSTVRSHLSRARTLLATKLRQAGLGDEA